MESHTLGTQKCARERERERERERKRERVGESLRERESISSQAGYKGPIMNIHQMCKFQSVKRPMLLERCRLGHR
eukprot:5957707-Amphidinium_carterae.1